MARIAQVGCGHWGKNLTRNFAELGALAAVVEGNPDTARAMSEAHGVPARDWAEVLADPGIDAVALATPAETHAPLALEAFAAGKHVYVEKPMALSIAEAQAMIAAAEAAGRVLMVGHLLHYHPVFRRLKAEVEAGRIGALRYIYSNRLSLGKFRTEENVMWSFAPHDVSMILSLVGAEPEAVTAQGAAHATAGVADWATMQLRFAGGVAAHVTASWMHPFKEHRLVVVGEEGMLVFEDSKPVWEEKLTLYPHRIDTSGQVPVPVRGEAEPIVVEKGEPLRAECAHFIDCIETGGKPLTDGAEGLAVLRVLMAADRAMREG
ncbi:UDP-2-acetamido-3-amino-2,3-dideoxy-glucuronate N-acetyltransferase [Meinhardsimonia xiamenensis]|jgi:UDP-2-acetamido-3-amino-2,3-dideoxy-glucuronate N-acetyltransferase|uniref:UDP-2-acetamido-3-amino-2,3-dideoxy-glucuronate N-acetyltransferase n=1 Tax=Meinhardsimonia xiamenensis TaxID=990712 RepID=A0A1G9HJS4_9RHOB|nr:Gfo/Idh/MocA family oxidoreductase [Meinhardsimonia xiamenensis]PRX27670.1 UDP-2-acetamido-3-amino-2,3-dideoxy-glucuronate N-acetyltransferase [Meinhardsimonia xiamenensis]SDL13179.1 UDP-2-acetamido-3-amino-2,3-dideoxy-glucuronate N-acetyltransferase [Meinhardsimonia xiamenensis]